MGIKLVNDEQILNEQFRVAVIRDLEGSVNLARKREARKRYEVFKDQTVKWVIQKLRDEGLKDSTLKVMVNRASNISVCRKVINKLARCYSGGVKRDTGTETGNLVIDQLAQLLNFDQKQKKADKYRKLFKNALSLIVPELLYTEGERQVFGIKKKIFGPHQYDVIESARDAECAGAIILSDYDENSLASLPVQNNSTSLSYQAKKEGAQSSLGKKKFYIWWTAKYHFTTDEQGKVLASLSPEGLLNPIGELPAVTYAEDQDGNYWAEGGEDLVDGSILINTLLTDMFAIAYMQAWGQLVITGKKIPEVLEGGPHSMLVLTYDDGDPEPKVSVVSANPPLAEWRACIEQLVALLLSTNDLAPSNVSVKLDASSFPSGIAMLIEKSQATGSIESTQREFAAGERKEWRVVKAWHNYLFERKALDDEYSAIGVIPKELEVSAKFLDTKEVTTEKEKLETIKLRKELALNTQVELIMLDNPSMTEEEAKQKLLKLAKERTENAISESGKIADEMIGDNGVESFDAEGKSVQKIGGGQNVVSKGKVSDSALNGAQVQALADLVQSVALGQLPRESAVAIVESAFLLSKEEAERILGSAGNGFKPDTSVPIVSKPAQVN